MYKIPRNYIVTALSGNIDAEFYKMLDGCDSDSVIRYFFKQDRGLFDVYFTDSNMLNFRDSSSSSLEPLMEWAKKENPELIHMALTESNFKVTMGDGRTKKCPFVYNDGEFQLLASAILQYAKICGYHLGETFFYMKKGMDIPILWDISEEELEDLETFPREGEEENE